MHSSNTVLWTIGVIANHLQEPIHRIEYILRSRNICAKSTAGNCRIYDDEDVRRIAEILQGINARRDGAA